MKTAVRWFILLSGVYDLLVGAAVIAAARPADPAWLVTMTLGAFLLFAGALLIWAAGDLSRRAPVVAWQGLVRLWAAGATFYGASHGFLPSASASAAKAAAGIDVFVALGYAIGLAGVWRIPLAALLLGRNVAAPPTE